VFAAEAEAFSGRRLYERTGQQRPANPEVGSSAASAQEREAAALPPRASHLKRMSGDFEGRQELELQELELQKQRSKVVTQKIFFLKYISQAGFLAPPSFDNRAAKV
jgi:hypothetical protein